MPQLRPRGRMDFPHAHAATESNWLLAALPPAAYERVTDRCELVPLPTKHVLFRPDEPIGHIHFPRSGCMSMVSVMGDGSKVEVGMIGWEGMSVMSLVHGVTSVPTQCLVQI